MSLVDEDLVLVKQAVRRPPLKGRVSYRTALRHIIKGTQDGRVKFEAMRIGGRWFTSLPAIQRWFARLNAEPADQTPPPAPTDAAKSADQQLAAAGL